MQDHQLKALRRSLSLTQQEFGDAIGLSRKVIGEMETGKAPIERHTILAALYLQEHGGKLPDWLSAAT